MIRNERLEAFLLKNKYTVNSIKAIKQDESVENTDNHQKYEIELRIEIDAFDAVGNRVMLHAAHSSTFLNSHLNHGSTILFRKYRNSKLKNITLLVPRKQYC